MASRLRQVATCIGPGFVVTILEDGTWNVDAIPAPKYPGESKRFYTRDWARGYKPG
jgi:hypothetical protein